jgi:NDP-sugar pyrophosphorylase family protein
MNRWLISNKSLAMNLQLLVLAAGLGRRFGGDKQTTPVGPNGEWLLDYALRDAREAGFTEAVLVVRPDMAWVGERAFPLPVRLAFQEAPLGTAHAVWSARRLIAAPFAAINADDYYGPESYVQLAAFLREKCDPAHYALIGFPLEMTLSDSGPVSRAICGADARGLLTHIEERADLRKGAPGLPAAALVSMNCWAFHPGFMAFLDDKIPAAPIEGELFLPDMVWRAVQERGVSVEVIPAAGAWMGLTYASDLKALSEGVTNSPLHSPKR